MKSREHILFINAKKYFRKAIPLFVLLNGSTLAYLEVKSTSKKMFLLFLVTIAFSIASKAQTTIVLQPDATTGKDAYLRSLAPNLNYGTHRDFLAHAWTHSGAPVRVRGIIDFDLSSIPNTAIINSAHLSLYSYTSPGNGSHSTRSGPNESFLSRVTSAWDENTVTFNNQPSITTQNQVLIQSSTQPIQDYLNIDVSNLVQDMINDPNNSHGFLFKLATEQLFRRMLFASSDNLDSTLHPKLEITYTTQAPNSPAE